MTTNRTSQSCEELAAICKDDPNCDLTPSLYADFPSIAEKYKRMEEDLQSIVNICQDEKIKNFAREALEFDPLAE